MAVRYSGDCRITVRYLDGEALHRGTVAWTVNPGTVWATRHRRTVRVRYPLEHGSGRGVDHPAVFDEVARSVLSFVTAGDPDAGEPAISLPCAWDGDGPYVTRKEPTGRELPREYGRKINGTRD